MAHDQQTYRRGTTASLVGLVVQIILSVAIALVGLWSQSPALHAAAWYFIGGLPIWIILFLLYNQHRLERIETLEAEQLVRQDQQAAAIFEEHADDLDLARRRLSRLQTWGLNIASAIVAVYLLTVGGVLLWQNQALFNSEIDVFSPDASPLIMLFVMAGIGFLAFVIGRYLSGMTSVREWQLLRGGASYLMGNFTMAMLFVVAGIIMLSSHSAAVMGFYAVLIPGLMVLVGLEVLLTFLLGAYRPRKEGEFGRPAFDSRVLGMLTAPKSLASIVNETVNYQFGFEITSSWFYRLLSRAITPLVVLGLCAVWLSSSMLVVQPHEMAVVTKFGKVLGEPVGPGLHGKLPWPFTNVQKYSVGRVHQIYAGSVQSKTDHDVAILWTNQHAVDKEEYMVTAPTLMDHGDNKAASGSGVGLIPAEVVVQYRILEDRLLDYAQAADNPQLLLQNIADRHVNLFFASHDVDYLLTRGREEGAHILKEAIATDARSLGIEVVFVGLTGVHPPTKSEVADKFHEVINALQEKESTIQDAEGMAIRILAETAGSYDHGQAIATQIAVMEKARQTLAEATDKAEIAQLKKTMDKQYAKVNALLDDASGEIAKITDEAMAYRWQRAITERARAERFEAELEAFNHAPRYYRARQALKTLAEGLADRRKIILHTGTQTGSQPIFRFDFKDPESALDSILNPE